MQKINTFVAGYSVVESEDKKGRKSTSIALIVRDVVGRNPMIKVKANKSASVWLDKGFTLEEVKKEYPYGTPLQGFTWGAEIPSAFGGIYQLDATNAVATEVEEEEKV